MNDATTLTPPTADTQTLPATGDSPHGRKDHLLSRWWRGNPEDSPLARPTLLGLLLTTCLLYLWGLGASGWANSFYSAAAQAGSESWKAFFFGSSDAANSITVDKTPMSLWVMALSVRLFGLSSWSILAPQALMGVAAVGLLYATVRRSTDNAWAGLLAGTVLALTPVAVLMFRFNNPDALLTLLLIGSVAATLRAIESPEKAVRWLALGGALVGFAFLTKMLQAFLVLPPLALVYLLAAKPSIGKRLVHLLIAFGSMVAAAGWWIVIAELWPASSRPFIGGSTGNSVLELTLGYNGFGRLTGEETGSVGGNRGRGSTGVLRMFDSEAGGQIAWLLPAALLLTAAGLWFLRGAGRSDKRLSALVVWGGWLVVTVLTFSFMAGIFHAYYTVVLAPAIASTVAIGATILWERRSDPIARICLAVVVAFTASFAYALLDRSPTFLPGLKWAVVLVGFVAAFLLVFLGRLPRWANLAVAIGAMVSILAGPTAYAIDTAATPHLGSIPSAGPSGQGGPGGMGGGRMPGGPGGPPPGGQAGPAPTGQPQTPPGVPGGGTGGNTGGLLSGSQPTSAITKLLTADASSYTWAAAAIGSNSAAGYQLASEQPVMPIGGFNGSDSSPTLAQFEGYVADGEIHYFIASGDGGGGGPRPSGGSSSAISDWVAANFTARTVDGVTLYDLSGGIH
ncbi:MAG: glycosyltransferase family 39 protein [Aeromicrobium sp.]